VFGILWGRVSCCGMGCRVVCCVLLVRCVGVYKCCGGMVCGFVWCGGVVCGMVCVVVWFRWVVCRLVWCVGVI
jgi:hypothetical protein